MDWILGIIIVKDVQPLFVNGGILFPQLILIFGVCSNLVEVPPEAVGSNRTGSRFPLRGCGKHRPKCYARPPRSLQELSIFTIRTTWAALPSGKFRLKFPWLGFPWVCLGFALVFLGVPWVPWVPWVCFGFPFVPWVSLGFPGVFAWVPSVSAWVFLGLSVCPCPTGAPIP